MRYFNENAIGSGDKAVIARIGTRLLIAKLITKITGKVPKEYVYFKEVDTHSYHIYYSSDEMMEDIFEFLKWVQFGQVVNASTFQFDFSSFSNEAIEFFKDEFLDCFKSEIYEIDEEELIIEWLDKEIVYISLGYFDDMPIKICRRIADLYQSGLNTKGETQ